MPPIKRHNALRPLSHQHHYGLLVCWKIRQGLKNGSELSRIKEYCDFFFKTHLQPHFKEEELLLFPILGKQHPLIKKALQQHHRLQKLFCETTDVLKSISLIEEELEKHIRFEERQLFNEIQNAVTEEQAVQLEQQLKHDHPEEEDQWCDKFWE